MIILAIRHDGGFMNPIVQKTLSVLFFLFFLFCSAELILMIFGARKLNSTEVIVDIMLVCGAMYIFIRQRKIF